MPASLSKRGTIERLEVPPLNILSSSATEKQRIEFVRKHLDAMVSCGQRSLQHAWLVGRELDYIREKRAELKGRQWHRFVQTEFKIGERQAFDLMRVFRSFPGLRSLPKGIDSIRGSITYLQVQAQINEAENRGSAARTASASDDGTPEWEHGEDASGTDGTHSETATTLVDEPLCVLPGSARVREELRTMQQRLVQIAAADRAAFRKVKEFVRQQHARVCNGKSPRAKA